MPLWPSDYRFIKLLELNPFEQHSRGGWRFGTRRIADSVVDRLIASGRASRDEATVKLIKAETAK